MTTDVLNNQSIIKPKHVVISIHDNDNFPDIITNLLSNHNAKLLGFRRWWESGVELVSVRMYITN